MTAPLLLAALALAAAAQDGPDLKDPHIAFSKSAGIAAAGDAQAGSCQDKLDPAAPPDVDRQTLSAGNFAAKVAGRDFPSVFMAWEPASDLGKDASMARHDLVWLSPGGFGLAKNSKWAGLATAYKGTVKGGGPGTVRLAELRWYDGMYVDGDQSRQYLPQGHPFWQLPMKAADTSLTSPMFMLNYRDPCLQEQIARQCKAVIAAGLDGCMLDRWSDIDMDTALGLLKRIRAAIGADGLVVVNANGNNPETPTRAGQVLAASLPYINGIFAEGFGAYYWGHGGRDYAHVPYPAPEHWRYLVEDLKILERSMQSPVVNAIEGWGEAGDEKYLRALTTAVLTYSDAYVLYSRSNKVIPNHDHSHTWDPFWDKGLGTPRGGAVELGGGAARREFSGGTVVYNGSALSLPVSFPQARRSRALGASGTMFAVPPGDGDIFIK